MKQLLAAFIYVLVFALTPLAPGANARTTIASPDIETVFNNQQSNVQLEGSGKVEKILSDDSRGSRHQRFIIRVNAKLTVLISHNIDIAPRIATLKIGDTVQFYGEYEWNKKGGVVHWTHRDPKGHHLGGWLKHKGIIYQ